MIEKSDTPWLRDTIQRMSETVEHVRTNQEKLMVENATRLAKMEAEVLAVDKRVTAAKVEMKKEARRWGAAGGAGAGMATIIAVLSKFFMTRSA